MSPTVVRPNGPDRLTENFPFDHECVTKIKSISGKGMASEGKALDCSVRTEYS